MDEDAPDALDRLAEDYVRRRRAGEDVEAEAYATAHPDLAERIREVFPVLALMEGLKEPHAASRAPTAGDPAPAGAPSGPARIGPFEVRRVLGRGGMGRVYEVLDAAGERRALKVVHPHLLERRGFLARFLREIDMGLRLDHPGVVRTLASGVAEVDGAELPYVLLEYVEGETLRDLLAETGCILLARGLQALTGKKFQKGPHPHGGTIGIAGDEKHIALQPGGADRRSGQCHHPPFKGQRGTDCHDLARGCLRQNAANPARLLRRKGQCLSLRSARRHGEGNAPVPL